jgi:hypothetical protein
VCFVVCKTTSEQEHTVLTTLFLVSAENTDSWHAWKGDLQCVFPLDVMMVPLSAIAVTTDGERLTCSVLSPSETVCLGNFKFITNYFSSLSLSPKRGDEGAPFTGSTCGGASTLWWAMIEVSTKDFLIASCGEGTISLPSPRRHNMRASLAPATTTPWMENAPAIQAMTTVLPWTVAPRPKSNLLF